MTYDNEIRCKACGAVGINELEEEDGLKVVICECGECVKILDDEVAL